MAILESFGAMVTDRDTMVKIIDESSLYRVEGNFIRYINSSPHVGLIKRREGLDESEVVLTYDSTNANNTLGLLGFRGFCIDKRFAFSEHARSRGDPEAYRKMAAEKELGSIVRKKLYELADRLEGAQ